MHCFTMFVVVLVSMSYSQGWSIRSMSKGFASSMRSLFTSDHQVRHMEQEKNTGWVAPTFCNGLDCPKYRVVETKKDYELRKYSATRWVSTTMTGIDYDKAKGPMFHKLYNYITGSNEAKKNINMTAPVTIRFIPGQGPACADNFTISFFLSPKETNPPKPDDPAVFFEDHPERDIYVGSFGWYASMDKYVTTAAKMAAAIKDQTKFKRSYYYGVGYDSPWKFWSRHNEVWLVANE